MPKLRREADPLKITSAISPPRRLLALCSPRIQRTASIRLLLPEPLGPTMAVRPSPKSNVVLSAKLLKPTSSRRLSMGPPHCRAMPCQDSSRGGRSKRARPEGREAHGGHPVGFSTRLPSLRLPPAIGGPQRERCERPAAPPRLDQAPPCPGGRRCFPRAAAISDPAPHEPDPRPAPPPGWRRSGPRRSGSGGVRPDAAGPPRRGTVRPARPPSAARPPASASTGGGRRAAGGP